MGERDLLSRDLTLVGGTGRLRALFSSQLWEGGSVATRGRDLFDYLVKADLHFIDSELVDRAEMGSQHAIEQLIAQGAPHDIKMRKGATFLHLVTAANNRKAAGDLLQRGANPNAQDGNGNTALHIAVRKNVDLTKLLLSHNANPRVSNRSQVPAIHYALGYDGGNAHFVAHTQGRRVDMAILSALLDSGADVNAKGGRDEVTPLHLAVMLQNEECVAVFVSSGADVNAQDRNGRTPFHWAVSGLYRNTKIASTLLASGANQHVKDQEGETPLDFAGKLKTKPSLTGGIADETDKDARDAMLRLLRKE